MLSTLSGSNTVLILYKHTEKAKSQLTYKFKFIHLNNTLFYPQYYLYHYLLEHLRDRFTRFITSVYFHESLSPKPLKITLVWFQIFQIFGLEIFASQGAPPVSTTTVADFPLVSTTQMAHLEL